MTDTLCDIAPSVDEAMEEIQCDSVFTDWPHEGEIVALALNHGCYPQQFLCAGHLRRVIEVARPALHRIMEACGSIVCAECDEEFFTVDAFDGGIVLL